MNKNQKLYKYEITFGNFDVMSDVVEREPNVSKSYSEETFSPVGQYIAMPIIVVGFIIVSPFYIINMIFK